MAKLSLYSFESVGNQLYSLMNDHQMMFSTLELKGAMDSSYDGKFKLIFSSSLGIMPQLFEVLYYYVTQEA